MRIHSICLFLFSSLALAAGPPSALGQGATYRGGQQRSGQQRGTRVHAQASKGILKVGERSSIRIIVENTDDARILQVPEVSGLRFDKPRGPSTNSSTQWVNGRVSRTFRMTWDVLFRVDSEGEYDIPSFILEIQGRRVATRPIAIRAVKDMRGEDLGFLEIRPSSKRVVEGQPFTLELSFGWDALTEINYVNLYLPWWDDLPGTLDLEQPPLSSRVKRVEGVTINRTTETVVEELELFERNGRRFRQMRLRQSFIPTRSGTLEVPTSNLEFGRESRTFSLFDRPKRQRYIVQAEPFTIEVIPLPTEGQPFDFSGAVGSFNVRASTDTRDAVVGDSIKLVVEWSGSGNLEFFETPDLSRIEAFDGFRVYGRTEEKSFERRTATYDIAPLSEEVTEIPPISMSVFDPIEELYTTVASDPIAIRVRPLQRATQLEGEGGDRFERDIQDIDTRPLTRDFEALKAVPRDSVVFATMAGVPLLWLGIRTGVRRRRGDPSAPRERRRRRARKKLARDLRGAQGTEQKLVAFQSFLAARTDETNEAWIGRDPELWAREISPSDPRFGRLKPQDFAKVGALMATLDRAAWGGESNSPSGQEILATADELMEVGL